MHKMLNASIGMNKISFPAFLRILILIFLFIFYKNKVESAMEDATYVAKNTAANKTIYKNI